MEKEILILNSGLVKYKFEDRESTYNRVTFAFRDELANKDLFGFNNILSCSLDPSSLDITKDISPDELVTAKLGLKKAKDNTFKYIITEINGIEV